MASKGPVEQTFEKNPIAQSNEKLFKKSSKKKKGKRNTRDKFTANMQRMTNMRQLKVLNKKVTKQ